MKELIKDYYNFWFTLNDLYDNWAKDRGLTVNALFLLHAIDEDKGQCTQKELCQKLYLPKQTVNSLLSNFEKDNFITKETMPEDRRNKKIGFTPQGKQYAEAIINELHDAEILALKNMTNEDRDNMNSGNTAFIKNLTSTLKNHRNKGGN